MTQDPRLTQKSTRRSQSKQSKQRAAQSARERPRKQQESPVEETMMMTIASTVHNGRGSTLIRDTSPVSTV
ncbi:hypothetical protein R3P38DRAFT_3357549, partial [Favolaschia claudopus]